MRSRAFQVSAFNGWDEGWYNFMDMKEVTAIFDQLSEMVEKRDTEIKFQRVYIPKANGKLRPGYQANHEEFISTC